MPKPDFRFFCVASEGFQFSSIQTTILGADKTPDFRKRETGATP